MPSTRRIQRIGNSRGVILTTEMLEHLGVEDQVEVTFETGRLVLTAPSPEARLRPGPNRQSATEAMRATFAQYEDAMQQLADVPRPYASADGGPERGNR